VKMCHRPGRFSWRPPPEKRDPKGVSTADPQVPQLPTEHIVDCFGSRPASCRMPRTHPPPIRTQPSVLHVYYGRCSPGRLPSARHPPARSVGMELRLLSGFASGRGGDTRAIRRDLRASPRRFRARLGSVLPNRTEGRFQRGVTSKIGPAKICNVGGGEKLPRKSLVPHACPCGKCSIANRLDQTVIHVPSLLSQRADGIRRLSASFARTAAGSAKITE